MLIFDKAKEGYEVVNVKEYDTLTPLEAEFYNNGLPFSLTGFAIQLQVMKSDGNFVIQTEGITVSNNKLSILLNKDVTSYPGTVNCQIVLLRGGLRDTTFTFYLEVKADVLRLADSKTVVTILETLTNTINTANNTKVALDASIVNGDTAKMRTDINNLIVNKTKYSILWTGDIGEASTTVPLQLSDDPANYNILIIRTYLSFIITFPTSIGGNRAIISTFTSTSMTNFYSYDVYQGLRFEAGNKVYVDIVKVLQRDANGVGTVLSGDVAKSYGKITGIYGIKF